jgi:hypothetical protein
MDKRFKLTDEDVEHIIELDMERHAIRERAKSLTVDAICAKFGISHAYYYDLINGNNRRVRGVA